MESSRTSRTSASAKLTRFVAGSARPGRNPSDDVLGGGMEIALMVPVFLGLGFLLDRWLGTTPIFMIVMVVLGMIGVFCRLRYSYEARMQELEAERLARRDGHRRDGAV